MISNQRKKELEKQGYRFVGNHSAVKTCLWCRNAIRGTGTCYKNTFYGIDSGRCIQASVSMDICTLRCKWCWRDVDYSFLKYKKIDDPKKILDGFVREHVELLQGFGGLKTKNEEKFREAMRPKHIALSLAGETCLYPKLPELIKEIDKRGMTSFVVTNGTAPQMIKKLIKTPITQLYITLPAPDKKTYQRMCKPLIKNGWEKIMESLQLLQHFKRSVIRLTLGKGMNMHSAEKYAEILKDLKFDWLEIKAAMPIGYARHRMAYSQMPLHKEIVDFSKKICRLAGLKFLDEKKESRVCLIGKSADGIKLGLT